MKSDEPEVYCWYAFSDVTVNIRAKSKAAAIEILNSARGMSEGWPIDIWEDRDWCDFISFDPRMPTEMKPSEYRFNLLVEYHGSDKGVTFWTAYDTETYDGAPDGGGIMGFGHSPRAALNDLLNQLFEREMLEE